MLDTVLVKAALGRAVSFAASGSRRRVGLKRELSTLFRQFGSDRGSGPGD